jgi:peptidoglycan/xylan/chitin deacetylase (PgdA/CDA1 family)
MMYHRVAEETFDPWGLAVSPGHFTEQAEWLARNRKVLPLVEFADAHREGKLPRDAVAVTFDDGYACTFRTAAPVLERLGLPATVFLPAEPLHRGGEFWWDELEQLVLRSSAPNLTLDGRTVELGPQDQGDRHWRPYNAPKTPRQRAFRTLWSIIHLKNGDQVVAALSRLRKQAGEMPARESHRIGTVTEVNASGLEHGCHGLTHASLPALGKAGQAHEIARGKELLTNLIGSSPATFAFPFGDADRDAERSVREAGFVCACGSRQKFVGAGADMFALPRLVVEDTGARGLERMLSGR